MKTYILFLFFGVVVFSSLSPSQLVSETSFSNAEDSLAVIHHLEQGTANYKKGDSASFSKAIVHFEKAFEIADRIGIIDSLLYGKCYQRLGYLYEVYQTDIPKAIQTYRKGIVLLEPIDLSLTAATYFNLAHHWLNQGKFEKALSHYNKSLEGYLSKPSKNSLDSTYISWNYSYIGDIYRSKFAVKKDFIQIDTALHIYDKALQFKPDDGRISWRKARLYIDKKDTKSATLYIKKTEQLAGKNAVLKLKGQLKALNQQYQAALLDFKRALKEEDSYREKAKIHVSTGDTYLQLNQINKALYHYQQTLKIFIPSFVEENPNINPPISALKEKDAWIMQALINKGNAFKKRRTKDDLNHALNCYQMVFETVEKLMEDSENRSEQILRSYLHEVVEYILEIYIERDGINNLHKAFEAIEKNKAITLLKQAKKTEQIQIRKIQEIQDKLLSDTSTTKALLQYFVGENAIYAFLINSNDIQFKSIPFTSQLQKQIVDLQKSLSNLHPNRPDDQFSHYTHNAQSLYQKLFLNPFGSAAFQNIEHLFIVPDGLLYRIPFEALLTKAPTKIQNYDLNYQNLAYLLKSHAISYAYSSTLLLESLAKTSQSPPSYKGNLLGFAPSFEKSYQNPNGNISKKDTLRDCKGGELNPLPFSGSEVDTIHQIIGGQVFVKTDANKIAFINEAQHYRILHLSTHACMDEEDHESSRIYFADQPLLSKELYPLQLQADLAVLSACETGTGPIQEGEGVMSLARAFLYAGCPSVVTSLWSVSDEKTSEIMSNFYRNLKQRQSKSSALQNAKLTYLQNQNNENAHPFYWAAFIQIGNPDPIDLKENTWNFWGFLILALGLTTMLFFRLKFRNKSKHDTLQ